VLSTIFSASNDLIVILIAVVVLFGGSQLPKLAKNTGEALREFRKSHSDAESGSAAVNAPAAPPATPALPPTGQVPTVQVPTVQAAVTTQAVAAPVAADTVTMTKAELDALVADRVAQTQAEGPKAGS
jgi:sec-independent protein translocase protein TatA